MDNEQKTTKPSTLSGLEALAIKATTWVGSVPSLIVHTLLFLVSFVSVAFGVPMDRMLLVLTTILSLEAIYLAIFIQMSVNRQAETIEEISDDVDELTEDVEELSDDVEEVAKDVDEISHDLEELSDDVEEVAKDVDEIAKDVDEISDDLDELSEDVEEVAKDVDEIAKDVDEISGDLEEFSEQVEKDDKEDHASYEKIESMLRLALADLEKMRK